jgi:PEP-CTERM motif-containing protein
VNGWGDWLHAEAVKKFPQRNLKIFLTKTEEHGMRRIVLLALLALALPTAALADNIDYGNAGSIGTNASVTGSATAGGTLTISSELTSIVSGGVTTTGNLGTVTVIAGVLVSSVCGPAFTGDTCFTFSGGNVTVKDTLSNVLFTSTLSGSVIVSATSTDVIYDAGGNVAGGFQFTSDGLVSGDTVVTPEPGTLGLLGTGLLGLAGMVRRKIRG